jgi:ribosomal protein L17
MIEEIDPIDYARAEFNKSAAFTEGFSLVTKGFLARGALARVLYGKKIITIVDARAILEFAREWSDVLLNRATRKKRKSFFRDTDAQLMMQGLMRCALEEPDHLRDIADTLIQLKKGGVKTVNDRKVALELITAYESCDGCYPTLPEIHRAFKDRFRDSRWPGDVSARRTLLALDIPLGKAKRGRPKGAKSMQKEYGLDKQPRKLIHKKS